MRKISCQAINSRVPDNVDGIQVNFCKNPTCPNYGVPASTKKQPRGRPRANVPGSDNYKVLSSARQVPILKCLFCNEYPPIKSNLAIQEEVSRLIEYLKGKKEPSCPELLCGNHTIGISSGKSYYYSFGKTKSGSQRYRCRDCGKTFSVGGATCRHKQPHKNKIIFKLLMNKAPLRRICEIADVTPSTLYAKINFLYQQCIAFSAIRERKLLNGMPIKRVYVGVDRQDYVINWTNRRDKRNVILHAVGSAYNETGYVFGMHLNFDPSLDSGEIEKDAATIEDYNLPHPFRRYARVWLSCDYIEAINRGIKRRSTISEGSLTEKINYTYDEALYREDIEVFEYPSKVTQLPHKGMQVHAEYTLYGHFFF